MIEFKEPRFDWFVYITDGDRYSQPLGRELPGLTESEAEEKAYQILLDSISEEPGTPLYSTWGSLLDEGLDYAVNGAVMNGTMMLYKLADSLQLPVKKALDEAKKQYDETLKEMKKNDERQAYEHYLSLKQRFEDKKETE